MNLPFMDVKEFIGLSWLATIFPVLSCFFIGNVSNIAVILQLSLLGLMINEFCYKLKA